MGSRRSSTRGLTAVFAGLAIIFSLLAVPAAAAPADPGGATSEILLSVSSGADHAELAAGVGAQIERRVPGRPDLMVLRVPAAAATKVASALESRPGVAFAAPNGTATIAAVNDPFFSYQWHLHSRARSAGSANWEPVGSATLGSGAVVAVLDTGVTAHSDLGRMLPGYDFISGDSDASDPHGHGTHVAGTVAELSNNGIGAAGVAPGASILPVRVLDAQGNAPYDKIFSGMTFAAQNGADVINLSLAGDADAGMCDAVRRAVAAGVTVVAATGNASGPVAYPAACSDAIAVSAVTMRGLSAPYSNTGPQVAISAPGGTAEDLNLDGRPDGVLQYAVFNDKGGYYYSSGTSMASPHVAGAAAIVKSIRPGATPAQVRNVLASSATDAGLKGPDPLFGAGILDVTATVTAAHALPASTQPAPTTEPAPTPEPEPTPEPTPTTEPEPEPEPVPAPETSVEPAPNEPAAPPEAPAEDSAQVSRFAGPDRFATAAAVSASRFAPGADHVWLATGASYADALSTGAAAGRRSGPLLLVEGCAMPSATGGELSRLRPKAVTVVGGPAAVCDGVLQHTRSLTGVQPTRVAGADRFATAAALSRTHWAGGASTVMIASAGGFADALSGGALGASQDAPMLLASACDLPSATATELERLRPAKVLVMGGAGAVCDEVLDRARNLTGGTVSRVSGSDRYATATAASVQGWSSGSDTVFIASGAGFADGLAAGAAAAAADAPLLLVPACGTLPVSVRNEISRLAPSQVFAVGGEAAVCPEMLNQV